jgi:2-haloacid dehalogenase
MKLSQFKALTFDCYGTLIDWETGLWNGLKPFVQKAGIKADREEVLSVFGGIETGVEAKEPALNYRNVLAKVHGEVARHYGKAPDAAMAEAFGSSIKDWPAFPDSVEALRYLKQHYKLIILSNVDRASFAHSNDRLGHIFDAVVTAEDVGSYKPDRRNFEAVLRAVEGLGVTKEQILHTAQSVFHDIVPGRAFGLATAWINRRHGMAGSGATPPPDPNAKADFVFESMGAMAAAHRAGT